MKQKVYIGVGMKPIIKKLSDSVDPTTEIRWPETTV